MVLWERFLADHQPEFIEQLAAFCRIPSISALSEHAADVQRAADWSAARLHAAGLEHVRTMPTGGHPVVYGDWLHAPTKQIVLIYGHFDVQPVDPLDAWTTPPFDPDIRAGRMYARGASDNKGNILAAIVGVEALLATNRALPVNVKFLIEGQEEIGCPQMPAFVAANRELLTCEYVLNADGLQWSETEPALLLGLRGNCVMEITLRAASADLHSGVYGGALRNPLHALAELVASFHTPEGGVAVEGFYDDVAPLSGQERTSFAAVPFDEAVYLAGVGAETLYGEPGYSTYERLWARPTLEVIGMGGGFQGQGTKMIVPAQARAKISCRLVPHQDPTRILNLLEAHVSRHAPRGLRVECWRRPAVVSPYLMPADHPGNRAAREVLRELYGREPYWTRGGHGVPITEILLREVDVYSVSYGFSLPDEGFHAPNEFFRLASFERAQRAYALMLERLRQGD